MRPIIHFEIHASDGERAANFYRSVFGWNVAKWDAPMEYWLVSAKGEDDGIDGGIVPRRGDSPDPVAPVNAYVCTIRVPSVDEYQDKVRSANGTIVVEKMEVPGVGWLVYCKDTEGNLFGMMQPV